MPVLSCQLTPSMTTQLHDCSPRPPLLLPTTHFFCAPYNLHLPCHSLPSLSCAFPAHSNLASFSFTPEKLSIKPCTSLISSLGTLVAQASVPLEPLIAPHVCCKLDSSARAIPASLFWVTAMSAGSVELECHCSTLNQASGMLLCGFFLIYIKKECHCNSGAV